MTFVASCRDIFFPVPFPPSPFRFRRINYCCLLRCSIGRMLTGVHGTRGFCPFQEQWALTIMAKMTRMHIIRMAPGTEPEPETGTVGTVFVPDLPFLAVLEFLVFFLSKEFLVFFSVFPFFSRDFRGSLGTKKILVFWVVFLAVFQKSKERKIRGRNRKRNRNRWNRFSGTETGTGTVPFCLNASEVARNPLTG